MSYHNTQPNPSDAHDWTAHAERTLRFCYGHDHAETRKAMTDADLASWRALGSRRRG